VGNRRKQQTAGGVRKNNFGKGEKRRAETKQRKSPKHLRLQIECWGEYKREKPLKKAKGERLLKKTDSSAKKRDKWGKSDLVRKRGGVRRSGERKINRELLKNFFKKKKKKKKKKVH